MGMKQILVMMAAVVLVVGCGKNRKAKDKKLTKSEAYSLLLAEAKEARGAEAQVTAADKKAAEAVTKVEINDPRLKEELCKQLDLPYGEFAPPVEFTKADLGNVIELILADTQITDAGLKDVVKLHNLHKLYLNNTKITDTGLKDVAKLQKLTWLTLANNKITDEGLKEVAKLQKLEGLILANTQITDEGIKELAKLQKLKHFDLEETKITSKCLKDLAKLQNLTSLNLNYTSAHTSDVKELRKAMPNCDIIHSFRYLSRPQSSLSALASLQKGWTIEDVAKLQKLRNFDLSDTQITDADLKEVAKLQNLTHLYLSDTQITDAGLKEIAKLQKLEWLFLGGAKVTKAGVAELQKALPKCNIVGP